MSRSETLTLLDRWKAHNNIPTDAEAARRLGVTRNAVYRWRHHGSEAGARVVLIMLKQLRHEPRTTKAAKNGKSAFTEGRPRHSRQ